ncbi:MAG: hypothetical protein DMF63_02455 [Acidobacteria bacterium]|nr:MAG: hypothetical protein DMF63_02455 [Acidobacteriota bacterium]
MKNLLTNFSEDEQNVLLRFIDMMNNEANFYNETEELLPSAEQSGKAYAEAINESRRVRTEDATDEDRSIRETIQKRLRRRGLYRNQDTK